MNKKFILEKPTIATWYSALWGMGAEIKEIEYGIDDYLLFVTIIGEKQTPRKQKIRYKNKRAHVVCDGLKIYLDECVRV